MRSINRTLTQEEAKESYYRGDFNRSFRLTEAMAYQGDKKAEYSLGYMYYYGIGAPQNRSLGIAWMREAAKKGYPPAVVALNVIYENKMPPNQLIPQMSQSTQTNRKTFEELLVTMNHKIDANIKPSLQFKMLLGQANKTNSSLFQSMLSQVSGDEKQVEPSFEYQKLFAAMNNIENS